MDDNSIKNQLQNVKAKSKRMSGFCGLVLIICIILAIYLFIDDSRSASDGGLSGAIAAFVLIPIAIVMIIMLGKQSRKRVEIDKQLSDMTCAQKDTVLVSDKTKSGDANSAKIISFLKNEKRAGVIWKIICSIASSYIGALVIASPLIDVIRFGTTAAILCLATVIVILYIISIYCVISVIRSVKRVDESRRLFLIIAIVIGFLAIFISIALSLLSLFTNLSH